MTRKRLKASERKAIILANARRIFSAHGYEAARTQDIARKSGVSEALMYRHFPSKQALYRAVLREVIQEQDASIEALTISELNGAAFIRNLRAYFAFVVNPADSPIKEGFRLLLASLAGDTDFATLVYRRSQRLMNKRLTEALRAAQAAGDIVVDREISVQNTSMFTEHVGTMLNALARNTRRSPYVGTPDEIVRDGVWFCCRGVGFTDEAIARLYDA